LAGPGDSPSLRGQFPEDRQFPEGCFHRLEGKQFFVRRPGATRLSQESTAISGKRPNVFCKAWVVFQEMSGEFKNGKT